MSSTSLPISTTRFASALTTLPISSLHAKIHELQNSITHLEKSNAELKTYATEDGDKDCYEAMLENLDVIKRMQERIELVKREIVEVRGLPLSSEQEVVVEGKTENGVSEPGERADGARVQERRVETLSDEEVERLLNEARNGTVRPSQPENGASETQQEEDGVFL
jgi:cell division septum initiation protein DivIVA